MRWSTLSFLDLHVYPSAPKPHIYDPVWSLDAALRTIEWDWVRGPVILGEFGALRSLYGGDVVRAAYAMRDLQVDSCRRGALGLGVLDVRHDGHGDTAAVLQPQRDPRRDQRPARADPPRRPVHSRAVSVRAAPGAAGATPGRPSARGTGTGAEGDAARAGRAPHAAAALRKGLRVRVTAPFAGRATVRALSGRRVVGRGARRVPAGSAPGGHRALRRQGAPAAPAAPRGATEPADRGTCGRPPGHGEASRHPAPLALPA